MEIKGCISDFCLVHGKSYRIMTDSSDYQVSPESQTTIFVGLIEWTKYHESGLTQTRYVKGFVIDFKDGINPINGEYVASPNEVVHSMTVLIMENPNDFERMFNENAKPARGKKGKYPRISKKNFSFARKVSEAG